MDTPTTDPPAAESTGTTGETATSTLSLSAYLNRIINDGAENDDEIIARAMHEVPRKVIDRHIGALLRTALAGVWHQRRRANGIVSGAAAQRRDHPGVHIGRGGVHSGRSPKVAGIRQAVQNGTLAAWYRDELYTGTRKVRLGEATHADLMAVSAYYRSTADANQRVAERAEKIAATLQEHGVERVDQLPEEVALALAAD